MYRYTYGTRTAIPFISTRRRADPPMHVGAIFDDLQPIPNLGAWHGSEGKTSMSIMSFVYNDGHTFTISQIRSAHSFRNI